MILFVWVDAVLFEKHSLSLSYKLVICLLYLPTYFIHWAVSHFSEGIYFKKMEPCSEENPGICFLIIASSWYSTDNQLFILLNVFSRYISDFFLAMLYFLFCCLSTTCVIISKPKKCKKKEIYIEEGTSSRTQATVVY